MNRESLQSRALAVVGLLPLQSRAPEHDRGIKDKVVVVTGAGIGLGMARAFHAAGALVAMGDLRPDAVERAAADLGGERTAAAPVFWTVG